MANRYRYSQDSDYERSAHQAEQFEPEAERQFGESPYRDRQLRRNGRRRVRDDRDREGEPMRPETAYPTDYRPLDDYDRATFGSQSRYEEMAAPHNYFRPDDFGGEDYTRGSRESYGVGRTIPGYGGRGWSTGRYGGYSGYGEGGYADPRYERDYGYRNRRGFFERASDEVASWFGDRDAGRRREMDHRGRGPANYQRTPERLLEDACERLTDDPLVDARKINVTATESEITLDGTVDSRAAKRRAEDCVHDIHGVKHVQNNLRIDEDWGSRGEQSAPRIES